MFARTLLVIAAIVSIAAIGARPALADPIAIAKSVPTHLSEATSGGVWSKGDRSGVYRVMTLVVPEGDSSHSEVVAQWLQLEENKPDPTVVETVVIKEISDQKLQGAFVTLETEKDNEATLVVSSYDPIEDKDISMSFLLSEPGKYQLTKK